ncbi:MAG: hypothetical protein BJG00_010865 [Limnothrix sp. CACIAM 69d]|nr:MAG: hypothetical protein BJG00_010865 [Limnothrix sp. CACIAM 69d]
MVFETRLLKQPRQTVINSTTRPDYCKIQQSSGLTSGIKELWAFEDTLNMAIKMTDPTARSGNLNNY